MSLKNTKVLVLNAGYGQPPQSKGSLNHSLSIEIEKYLKQKGHETKITHMDQGYDVKDEVSKLDWADVIILQTPTWWLGLPGQAKTYIDLVLSEYFRIPNKKEGKKFMVSCTFACNEEALYDPNSAYQGLGPDQVYWTVYQSFFYSGIGKLPIVAFNDASNPNFNFDEAVSKLHSHLDKVFQ